MVQSQPVAPPRTIQSFEGYTVGTVCTPEQGCVLTHAKFCLRMDADGSWVIAFHDPSDPLKGWQQTGVGDGGGREFFSEMMTRLATLATPEP